jgi:uncharacterized membrane protein
MATVYGVIALVCISIILIACIASMVRTWNDIHYYQFEERTVYASYLEEARRKLDNYHSLLVRTDDKCVI